MATTTATPAVDGGLRLLLDQISCGRYVALSETLGERPQPRLIYCQGSLELVVTPRRHERFGERLAQLFMSVARAHDLLWDNAASATFRDRSRQCGIEGDKTYDVGENARMMQGGTDIDLSIQPPPDLAIEVEMTSPLTRALQVWSQLGVPEIWTFQQLIWAVAFWELQADGTYRRITPSRSLPAVRPEDIVAQMKLSETMTGSEWTDQLPTWIDQQIRPRLDKSKSVDSLDEGSGNG